MLSLFKDAETPLDQEAGMQRARTLLTLALNKGSVPGWDEFSLELPVLELEHLEQVREQFVQLTQSPFLEAVLNLEAMEFFFHGPTKSQRALYSGQKELLELPIQEGDWQLWLEILSIRFKQNWNVQNPFCSFFVDLFGKSFRCSMIHQSTSPERVSKLMLRSLAKRPYRLESFGAGPELSVLMKEKRNVLIAGSTGSGKTSLLTTLLNDVGAEEHLVVLEDTYEILNTHPFQTRFLAGDTPQTSLKSYLSYCLRLSPDRIILGEMRSHEVVPFLMAMNTGHKGLMGTIHASSAADALNRVSLLFTLYSGEAGLSFEKVMELICRNLEFVVFMENKKVKEVIRILGSDKGVPFFETIMGPKERSYLG